MKTIKYLLLAFCSIVLLATCKVEKHGPLEKSDWVPDPVSNVVVQNLNGAAKITYDIKSNPELMYVTAEFETQGKKRNAKATYYNQELLLDGFGDTLPHEVKLYAVSRSEVFSKPVTVTVTPQKPPAILTFESLAVIADFGGAWATYSNKTKADLGITIMHKDNTGAWVVDNTLYTEKENGGLSARGLDSKSTVFGLFVQDRWGNYSDTLITTLTPLFERLIPKPFKAVVLPTDNTTSYNANNKMDKLWDDIVGSQNIYYTAVNSGMPTWFTFDLGVTTQLSRFLYQQRNDAVIVQWGHGNPRYFEIWGSATTPNPDGSWTGWTKLMDVESVKPSGLPVGQNSDEDLALMYKGEEFNFPNGTPAVRYLRIKINETWNKTTFFHIGELTFWGQ
jgi:hypothetical protein